MDIIMPVKDSIDLTKEAIIAILKSGHNLTVYNDFSTQENTSILLSLSQDLGFRLINLSDLTSHPSPNYRLVLQMAQQEAVSKEHDLLIIESDVVVRKDTIHCLQQAANNGMNIGMAAAVTEDDQGNINFPYEYANKLWFKWKHRNKSLGKGCVKTTKRLSFCCTLLTLPFLQAFSFTELDPTKNWYDVTISHKSVELGFDNILMLNNRVLHRPHSSRPWKALKYSNPLLYYWRKLTQKKDRI